MQIQSHHGAGPYSIRGCLRVGFTSQHIGRRSSMTACASSNPSFSSRAWSQREREQCPSPSKLSGLWSCLALRGCRSLWTPPVLCGHAVGMRYQARTAPCEWGCVCYPGRGQVKMPCLTQWAFSHAAVLLQRNMWDWALDLMWSLLNIMNKPFCAHWVLIKSVCESKNIL